LRNSTLRVGSYGGSKSPVSSSSTDPDRANDDWQRVPLTTPLLNLAQLPVPHKDAVCTFRAVQQLMGDSEKGARTAGNTPRLEEARWLLGGW